jgi:hypothetical protein
VSVCTELGYAFNLKWAGDLPQALELNEHDEWTQPENAVGIARSPGWGELENPNIVKPRPLKDAVLYLGF